GHRVLLHLDRALPQRPHRRARQSVAKLAALDPLVVAPGHLGPLVGPSARAQLERAAAAN
ncbi:MAG TPA: hypothetical protein VL120_10890, partial [Solirubrobacteraceae bacterium]|nr:hypothetical protein [Solirubrobacteraceae bacterium]